MSRAIAKFVIFRYQDLGNLTPAQLRRLAERWQIPHEGLSRADLRLAVINSPKNSCLNGPDRVRLRASIDLTG